MPDEAVYTLIGIVVGGILSGAVQIAIAWRERENAARASCLILFADLVTARHAYADAIDDDEWWPEDLPLDGWEQYRDNLAMALPADDFHDAAAAFHGIATDDRHRKRGDAFALRRSSVTDNHKVIRLAQALVYARGQTYWDRRREQKQPAD